MYSNCPRQGQVEEPFRPTYDKLRDIRDKLEKLSLLRAWSLRETDLYSYQRELDKIDESRADGSFLDENGNKADMFHQRVGLLSRTPK